MAELSYFKEAKEIFNQLIEFSNQHPHILLNKAHLEFLSVINFQFNIFILKFIWLLFEG